MCTLLTFINLHPKNIITIVVNIWCQAIALTAIFKPQAATQFCILVRLEWHMRDLCCNQSIKHFFAYNRKNWPQARMNQNS